MYRIDRETGKATRVVGGLKNPHGGARFAGGFLATSTASGEVVVRTADAEDRYAFGDLPGKPEELGELEWVQNAAAREGVLVAIDSNRTAFVVFDPERRLYDLIAYDPDWAVQDLAFAPRDERVEGWLGQLGR